MMSYCTPQDLIDRFTEQELIELTDEHDVGEINATSLAKAIADTDALIESKIAARFTVPLLTIPMIINKFACDIARYYLYDDMATEQVTERYKDAVTGLDQIRDGKMSLGIDDPAPQSVGDVEYTTPGRQFSLDSLKDF